MSAKVEAGHFLFGDFEASWVVLDLQTTFHPETGLGPSFANESNHGGIIGSVAEFVGESGVI